MATELGSGGEPDQRLNTVLQQYEKDEILRATAEQKSAAGGDGILRSRMMDQSLSALVTEYDKHLEEMREQLHVYQAQMSEMRLKFEQVTKENERLHAELKEALEKQLEALPFMPWGTDILADEGIVRNLQEQLQLTNQEKEQAIELWQTVLQERDRLQQQYQERMTETQIHMAERQKQKDQLTGFQQLTQQLHMANEKVELSNQQFLKTVTEQNVELEQLRKQLRQAKIDGRTANAKVDEMTRLTEKLQGQLERKEEDVISAQQRETASDKRLQQMQSSIKQLETRLRVTVQEAEQLRTERTALEKQIRELQTKYANLEGEKYDAVAKVQDCIQLLEEANLQKSQALFGEKQKEEEIKKMKDEMSQLAEDTAARIRKAVDSAKKQYNVQISRLTEELSALQMECGEKQGQIERAIREKRAVEEELEKIYREDRGHESDNRKLEQLHQKYLLAETTKGDLQLSLQTTQNKLKQLEMTCEEEKSRCQEVICKLQSILDSEREKSAFVSEQRLKLQQENEQLQKEMEGLRKLAIEAQQKAKIKISTMEHEHAVKEHGYEARLKEMEDTSQKSTAELRRLLVAQQKATNRWKEETKNLTETTEARISKLKSELSQQKLRSQELISQLEMANEKVTEDEKLMMEYREYINRLQGRLSQAEQRAATASQKLSLITTQKKKAASLKDLENI
ncbi:sodium channel and clathrin linker 1 isoform X1 [Grus americana]|uniref:sodium channel and clathrin linker 1 isoform X1 n=3 Tax=Grus americana TaxID=9117 RepID=UPI0024081A06|nr:sodium channel and clathrin linker 1 isoform X1 [Grus americana]XP_054681327.1 sodium channel and clathrin linker 1 isoform X1 [Grus americana]XP_054681328.1 sodium channel and clathrin linker 1 isoform X1 [Grus americana]XP_054681329.1 sodium channel and clathrin linker 1 isoform X1 [Grus americana]